MTEITERDASTPAAELPPNHRRRLIGWWIVSGAGVVTMLVLLFFLIRPFAGDTRDVAGSIDGTGTTALPVRLMKTVAMNGVELTVMSSTLNPAGSYLYTLDATIVAREEIRSMKLRIELIDESGRVVSSDTFDPLEEHHAPLLPGSVATFREQKQATPAVREVRIGVESIDRGAVLSMNGAGLQ